MTSKPCSGCGITKPLESYYVQRSHSTGRRSECKACYWMRRKARARASAASSRWLWMTGAAKPRGNLVGLRTKKG